MVAEHRPVALATILPATQTIPNNSPPAPESSHKCPETIQEPGIVLEFFWRDWNFIFAVRCAHRYEIRDPDQIAPVVITR